MNTLALPQLTPWLAGDQLDEDMFNDIQDALEFLANPPECRVASTATQSIPTSDYEDISFTKVTKDNCAPFGSAMWALGDPTKVYARLPGWYECQYTISWTSTVDNKKRAGGIRWNGEANTSTRGWQEKYHLSDRTVMNGITPIFMNTDEYLTLTVWHNKGSSTDISMDGFTDEGRETSMHIRWVSL